MPECDVCFRHCSLKEGETGFCGARICKNNVISAKNYGKITSLALDPIEKKPLRRFYPGSLILSVGSYGCNVRCPFCQNYSISWGDEMKKNKEEADFAAPEMIASTADHLRYKGNIGVAFTYNEPLIGYEFVRDTAKLIHQNNMKNVLVTNGTAEISILEEILPYIDAMNIDLKGFSEKYYKDFIGGSFRAVTNFIERAVKSCHIEITVLIIPGENDSEFEMKEISSYVAGLEGKQKKEEVPLHISRFFPKFKLTDRAATDVSHIYKLADIARDKLKYVYTGNC